MRGDKWGIEAGHRSVHPTCHRPGCLLAPADVDGPGEEAEYCPAHLDSIRAIRSAMLAREKPKGGPKASVKCGTEPGFNRHRRERTKICADCDLAHKAAVEAGVTHRRRAS